MTERYAWMIAVTGWDGEFEAAWREGSKAVQVHPGAKGTTLYRLAGRPHEYMAVAEWDSRQARDDAVAETPDANTRYGRVTALGWLEEVAKVEPVAPHIEQFPVLASEPSGTVFVAEERRQRPGDGYYAGIGDCRGCGRYIPVGERWWLHGKPVRLLCPACYDHEKARAS